MLLDKIHKNLTVFNTALNVSQKNINERNITAPLENILSKAVIMAPPVMAGVLGYEFSEGSLLTTAISTYAGAIGSIVLYNSAKEEHERYKENQNL